MTIPNESTLDFMIGRDEEGNVLAELDSWSLLHDENSLDFEAINDKADYPGADS